MKISEVKQLSLEKLVLKLQGRYSHTDRKGDDWYFSPFRPDEKTPSFKVNSRLNIWHDFGLSNTLGHNKQGSGGDIIDLWCDYHLKDRRLGVKDALTALANLNMVAIRGERLQTIQGKDKPIIQNGQPRYKILKISDRLTFGGLKDELVRRRISLKVANLYLKQGYILDTETKKTYNGFLFENDKGGFEVSIPNPLREECFKTCIGPKASTRILVSDRQNSADVFEGFWDFLSWLEYKAVSRPINHSYILNSTSLTNEVCEKLIAFKETVKYVFLFMDHDEAGYQATHAIAKNLEEHEIMAGSIEQLYKGYNDINSFWIKNPTSLRCKDLGVI